MAAPHARMTPDHVAPNEGVELDPLRNPERRRRAADASAIDIACGGEIDSWVLIAAADAIAPHIAAARDEWDGRLPRIRSEEWLAAPDSVKVATLLTCGIAYFIADPHRVVRDALKQISNDLRGDAREGWRRAADSHVPHEEMTRRRDWNTRAAQTELEAQRDDVA